MNWVVSTIVCSLAISFGLNLIVHLVFKLTGGAKDDDE